MPFASPVRVPALRDRIGRFGGFVEPRPTRMSARSRLRLPGPSGPVAPAARHPRPCCPVFLRVRLVVKTRPRVAWTLLKRSLPLPGGFGCSGVSQAVPRTGPSAPPHPPARARGTILGSELDGAKRVTGVKTGGKLHCRCLEPQSPRLGPFIML